MRPVLLAALIGLTTALPAQTDPITVFDNLTGQTRTDGGGWTLLAIPGWTMSVAIPFTPGADYTLDSAAFYLHSTVSPGEFQVQIRQDDAGKPGSVCYTSPVAPLPAVGLPGQLVTVTLAETRLSAPGSSTGCP